MKRASLLLSFALLPVLASKAAFAAASTTAATGPTIGESSSAYKALEEAGKTNSEGNRIDMLAPQEASKLQAETAKLIAEAYRTLTEAHLNEAKTQQVWTEIQALQQRMRVREYEFQRIVAADFQMNEEILVVEQNQNLVRPLVLGRANWRTWVGLEYLMQTTGDADIIVQVMFDIPVPALSSSEFVKNGSNIPAPEFVGGNLGELYTFAQENDLSFKKFGQAHKNVMRILAMVSKAAELRINELRDINQAVRLTIANIYNP